MPLYDFKCNICGDIKEEFHSIKDRHRSHPCICGGEYRLTILKSAAVHGCDSFNPHWDVQTGEYYETKEHKASCLKKLGWTQSDGPSSPRKSTPGTIIGNKAVDPFKEIAKGRKSKCQKTET